MDKQTFLQAFADLYEARFWQAEESCGGIDLTFSLKESFCSHALCEDLFLLLRASNLDWYIDLDAPAQSLLIRVL